MLNDIDFDKHPDGLVPAIIQHAHTRSVLMLGYMNEAALRQTLAEKRVTFFSRSKNRLWTKGESSGHFLDVLAISADCDRDTLLVQALPHGPVCHLGTATCFGEAGAGLGSTLAKLEGVIAQRFEHPQEGSYVSSLAKKGINKMAQKVGEEAVELVIEAKDNSPELFLGEAADLMFHFLVLLRAKGHGLQEVEEVLRGRLEKTK